MYPKYLFLFLFILPLLPTQLNAQSFTLLLDNNSSTDFEITASIKGKILVNHISNKYEVSNEVYKHSSEFSHQENLKNVFKDKTILIDAGHGGHDVGAIGASESFEKNITYLTASELERTLTSLGANVLITRKNDDFISLKARTAYSNTLDIDVFLSLHYNSFPEQTDVSGIETYYYHDQHKELAQHIQHGLIEKTNARDRGTSKGDYLVLRQNLKPSVLLELGFISNREAEDLLQTNLYQKKLVAGIVSGLKEYFTNKNKWDG